MNVTQINWCFFARHLFERGPMRPALWVFWRYCQALRDRGQAQYRMHGGCGAGTVAFLPANTTSQIHFPAHAAWSQWACFEFLHPWQELHSKPLEIKSRTKGGSDVSPPCIYLSATVLAERTHSSHSPRTFLDLLHKHNVLRFPLSSAS